MNDKGNSSKVKYPDVTIAEVKECKGYGKINDELAQSIVDAIRIYTEIIYTCYLENRFEEQKTKLISINQEANNKAA